MKSKLYELRNILDTILNSDDEYQDLRYVLSQVETCSDPRIDILTWMLENDAGRGRNDIQPLLDKIADERTWLMAFELAGDHESLMKYLDSDDCKVRDRAVLSLTALGGQVVEPLREEFNRRRGEAQTMDSLSQCITCKQRVDEKLELFALSAVDVVKSVDIESVPTQFLVELFEKFDGDDCAVIDLLAKKEDKAVVQLFLKACKVEYNFDMADYLWTHGVYRFVRQIIENDGDCISPPENDGQIEYLIDFLENLKYESDVNFGYDLADTDWGDTVVDLLSNAECSPELNGKIDAVLMYRVGTDDIFREGDGTRH